MKEKYKSHRFGICDVDNDISVSHEHTICFRLAHTFISRAFFLLDLKNPFTKDLMGLQICSWWCAATFYRPILSSSHIRASRYNRVTSLYDITLFEMSQLWETLCNYAFLCISCELPPECPPSAPSSLYARQLPTQEKWGIGRGGFLPQFTIFLIYVGKPKMGTHLLHLCECYNIWKSIWLKCTNYISYSNQPSLSLHGLQRKL